ncbi:MFS transporter [Pleomorphomonas diazotrophica]|uniref:MFS transporter n=1 Tax=Pleomorphomonas diazotrophica TaxID=1166257 RepID=A0A1I4UVI0_9HYPH|nr:MFS transporter [Pleomorphomonas diazotrophica]PKR89780.1 MFS transporter [Pleomorphomonas diazotrophica]SFM92989.1 Predicted arabinose efflux permease, MFS family [Pleomorphomonas diazotrophica]
MSTPGNSIDPREGRARWAGVASLSLGVFGLVTAEFLPASLLTPMSQDLGVSLGAAGQSVTMTAVVGAVAGPAIVVGTSRFDRRLTLLALTAMLILSSFIAAFATGLPMLLLARGLLGIGLGGFWAMSLALAMRLVPSELMPRAMAIIMGGVSVATVCAAPVGAWIGDVLGWRYAFGIAGGLGVLTLIAQASTLPAMPSNGPVSLDTMVTVLRRPAIRIVLLTILLAVAGHFAGFTFIRPFLEDVPQFGIDGVSRILLAFGIGGFLGNFAGGFLAERNTSLSLTLAAGGIAIMALLLTFAGASPVVAAVATAFWGFAFGAFPVGVQSFVNQAASDEPESAGALMLTTFQIAISSGAVLGGLIVDSEGPTGVFMFAGLFALTGATLIGFAGRSRLSAAVAPSE